MESPLTLLLDKLKETGMLTICKPSSRLQAELIRDLGAGGAGGGFSPPNNFQDMVFRFLEIMSNEKISTTVHN